MTWIIPALIAPFTVTIVNFIDKYVVEKEVKDYRGMPIFVGITGLVVGTAFWFFTGQPILAVRDMLLLLTSGILTVWSSVLYFKAMSLEEASKVIILFQSLPIFILLLSFIFLGERLTYTQLLGFVVILASVIGASDTKLKGFQVSPAFWLILGVNVMWAVAAILIKFTVNQNSFYDILSFESWGIGLGAVVLFIFSKGIRGSFIESFTTVGKRVLAIMFTNEGLFVVSKAMMFLAYSLGPAALVSVVNSTTVFFGILFGLVLTIFLPHIIQEDIGKTVLLKKSLFAALLFIGIILAT